MTLAELFRDAADYFLRGALFDGNPTGWWGMRSALIAAGASPSDLALALGFLVAHGGTAELVKAVPPYDRQDVRFLFLHFCALAAEETGL